VTQPSGQSAPSKPLRYWVCSSQRSGSALLCDLLSQTGEHGDPTEYLDIRRPLFRELYLEAGGTRDRYVAWLLSQRASTNGSFGLKLHWHQGVMFVRGATRANAMAKARLGIGLHAMRGLSKRFGEPTYVWVRRRDQLGQAISHYRARRTNQWDKAEADAAPRPDPPFDAAEIDRSLRWLARVDGCWRRYFAWTRTTPFEVGYEDLAADPAGTMRDLGVALGVPITIELEPRVERQRSDWSSEMRAEYLKARGPA